MGDEADTDAAHILVELANRVVFPAKINAQSSSSGRSYGCSRMAKNGLLVVGAKMKPMKLLNQHNSKEDDERECITGLCGLSTKRVGKIFKNLRTGVHDGLGKGYAKSKKTTLKRKARGYGRYSVEPDECDDFDSKLLQLSENPEKKLDDMLLSPDVPSFVVPTIHTGFSFSVIHLLAAVRMALVAPRQDDINFEDVGEDQRMQRSDCEENDLPCLAIHEIVSRVRSKPGDLGLLETREPLLHLVRLALKTFSSKTSPLGAMDWKPLTRYANRSRKWRWVGPAISVDSRIDDYAKIETASKAWDLPHRMLVNLVDCYAHWLGNELEVLKEIDNLPVPRLEFMQPIDANERFKGLAVKRSPATISPSSEEVRTHFRREEALRYLIPDRAFSYTASDGKKSSVAPLNLRMGSDKPSARVRKHFMLRASRSPCVTVDCLVRDAAARLPDRVGTRGDVCTLMRDSQFILDCISDLEVSQVVSAALDRLHSEFDPCVKYDKCRHLWVYLHGEREEADFGSRIFVPRKKA